MDIDGKRLSELPLTYRFADDGTIIMSSATEGSKRIDLATFIELIGGGGAGSADLASLRDVVINSPADKQILQYDAQFGKWTNRTQEAGNQTLNELSDVNITQVQDKQVLGYDNITHRWKNMQAASSVDTLTDVNLNNLSDKQILKYNNTIHKWENVDLESGGTAIYYLNNDQDLPTGDDIEDAFYIVTENQTVDKIVFEDSNGLDLNNPAVVIFKYFDPYPSPDKQYHYTTKSQYDIIYKRDNQIRYIVSLDLKFKLPEIIINYHTADSSTVLSEDASSEFTEHDNQYICTDSGIIIRDKTQQVTTSYTKTFKGDKTNSTITHADVDFPIVYIDDISKLPQGKFIEDKIYVLEFYKKEENQISYDEYSEYNQWLNANITDYYDDAGIDNLLITGISGANFIIPTPHIYPDPGQAAEYSMPNSAYDDYPEQKYGNCTVTDNNSIINFNLIPAEGMNIYWYNNDTLPDIAPAINKIVIIRKIKQITLISDKTNGTSNATSWGNIIYTEPNSSTPNEEITYNIESFNGLWDTNLFGSTVPGFIAFWKNEIELVKKIYFGNSSTQTLVELNQSSKNSIDSLIRKDSNNNKKGVIIGNEKEIQFEDYHQFAYGDYSVCESITDKNDYLYGAHGFASHTEGYNTGAFDYSHAEGINTKANGNVAHAEGCYSEANEYYSHAEGYKTYANNKCSHASGHFNADMTIGGDTNNQIGTAFVIGNGTSDMNKSNAFSVQFDGTTKAAGTITASTTADYAELFEWQDENPNGEDRVGHFVTIEDNKIKIASPNDDYILGIISGAPFVLGNGDCDVWNGMYLRDEFNRYINIPTPKLYRNPDNYNEEEYVFDENDNQIFEGFAHKINPEYDPNQKYISRLERSEWAPVGMLGVLAVIDDGTCQVNGYCKVAEGGIATASARDENTWRVIKRITENVVQIIFK